LCAADAVVVASEREQFGQVLVEGMACGLPAAAPRSLGPALIIEDGRTGWLTEPDNEEALAAAMTEMIERPDERVRRGEAARKVVRQRFSWARISARLAAVLEGMTGNRPGQPTTSTALR
jgi:glycosyltransferase involved in cell wall biosynthesis